MKLLGRTKRLTVFVTDEFVISQKSLSVRRRQVLAYPTYDGEDVHCPMLVVNMLLADYGMSNGLPMVDWMETCEMYREQGFGREVFELVERKLGPLYASGGTNEGIAFLDAVEDSRPAEHPARCDTMIVGDQP